MDWVAVAADCDLHGDLAPKLLDVPRLLAVTASSPVKRELIECWERIAAGGDGDDVVMTVACSMRFCKRYAVQSGQARSLSRRSLCTLHAEYG